VTREPRPPLVSSPILIQKAPGAISPRIKQAGLEPDHSFQTGRAETERDGTRAENRFGFPAKRTSPFISAGVSVQSAAGSRGVRISGSNAG